MEEEGSTDVVNSTVPNSQNRMFPDMVKSSKEYIDAYKNTNNFVVKMTTNQSFGHKNLLNASIKKIRQKKSYSVMRQNETGQKRLSTSQNFRPHLDTFSKMGGNNLDSSNPNNLTQY